MMSKHVIIISLLVLVLLVIPVSATTVVIYPTVDAVVARNISDNGANYPWPNWGAITAGSGTEVVDGVEFSIVGLDTANLNDVSEKTYLANRRYVASFDFTTSNIPANATITSVVYGNRGDLAGTIRPDWGIVNGTLTSYTSAPVMGDYQKIGNTELAPRISYANWNNSSWNNYTFNAAGLNYATQSKGGYLALFFTSSWDIDRADGAWDNWSVGRVNLNQVEKMGSDTTYDPFLEVTYSQPVVILPVASFTSDVTSGTAPLLVKFNDTSTNSPTSWNWSFTNVTGNNTPVWFSTQQNATYTFGVGNYSIALNASNSAGHNLSAQVTFINVTAPIYPPISSFTSDVTSGTAPLVVKFNDTSTNSPTSWNWSFTNVTGNNTPVWFSTQQNATYTFGVGNYSIALNASNSAGHTLSAQVTFINVTAAPISRITNVGVFRGLGYWYLDKNNNGTWDGSPPDMQFYWGKQTGDIPITGDWNNNGITETGIFRPGGTWFLDTNNNGVWDGTPNDTMLSWGKQPGDKPITGDWNHDGITETGIFRNGIGFYLDTNNNGVWDGTPNDTMLAWGLQPNDIPVTGDWNGNGTTETGIFRPGTGFYLDTNNNGVWDGTPNDTMLAWGLQPNDIPVTGDWNNNGITETGIFRNGDWYLDINNNGVWDSGTDVIYLIGQPGDKPVTGKWS